MAQRDTHDWMWSDALDMLARAERLHRQMFQPLPARAGSPSWEPPVDVVETDTQVVIMVALPGVAEAAVQATIDGSCLIIAGERVLPVEMRSGAIHRMELPVGRFERRVPLPPGRFDQVHRRTVDGCLVISLHKV